MNLRVVLTVVTALSAGVTGLLGAAAALAPDRVAAAFGVDIAGVQTGPLIPLLAGTVMSLALFQALAAHWTFGNQPHARTLVLFCAASLLGVALLGGLLGGSTQVLWLDGLRGALLMALGAAWRPPAARRP